MTRFVPILLATVLAAGCGPSTYYKQYSSAAPVRFCEPKEFGLGKQVPPGSRLLADLNYGDTGFSVSCGVARNKARLRDKACSIGADAIQIVAENFPSGPTTPGLSTCYRVKAKLYKLPEPPAQ